MTHNLLIVCNKNLFFFSCPLPEHSPDKHLNQESFFRLFPEPTKTAGERRYKDHYFISCNEECEYLKRQRKHQDYHLLLGTCHDTKKNPTPKEWDDNVILSFTC